jgi:hypothetical protein
VIHVQKSVIMEVSMHWTAFYHAVFDWAPDDMSLVSLVRSPGLEQTEERCFAGVNQCQPVQTLVPLEPAIIRHDINQSGSPLPRAEQIPDSSIIVHRDMQVDARDGEIRVPRGDANLGQSATAGQGVANKRVPAVVDRERA